MTDGQSFFELLKQSTARRRIWREIHAAVRSRAQGRSRDEAREILVEEIRSRGQEVPPQPLLDVRLDAILANDSPGDRAKMTMEAVSALGEMGLKLGKMFRAHKAEDSTDPGFDGSWVPQDRKKSVEIELDDDAQSWIGQVDEESSFSFRHFGMLRLQLHLSSDGSVVAHVGDRRVGILNDADAETFRPCFSSFGREHHILFAAGNRYRTPEGLWRVYVYPPEERYRRLLGLDIDPGDDLPMEAIRQLREEPLPPTPSGRLRYDRQRKRWVDGSDVG
jgi:hypothetical protein